MSRLFVSCVALAAFTWLSLLATPARSDKGANTAPSITNFLGTEGYNRIWTFTGKVVDEHPGGLTVRFGGIPSLQGQTTTTLANGTFAFSVQLQPGEGGEATAQTTDAEGLDSNLATCVVRQT